MPEWVVCPVAFFLGSIPFAYIITRLKTGEDIRTIESGNVGATNVSRRLGLSFGILVALLDIGKGVLAIWIAGHFTGNPLWLGGAFFLAVAGHCYTPFLRFQGGKGVATSAGVFFTLAPKATMAVLGVFVVAILIKRYVSLGSILAAGTFPFFYFLFYHPPRILLLFTVLTSMLIIWRHRKNIQAILAGTERRFPSRSKK